MTYGQLMDAVVNQEMPYKDEIEKGETLSFNVDGKMMPVQVTRVGWEFVEVTSLDLKFKWDRVPKSKWIVQRNLLKELGLK